MDNSEIGVIVGDNGTPRTTGLARLLEPFEPHLISLLPKPYKKDSEKGNCDVCGKFHGLPATHLEYVGHAALTFRLLEVDPLWNWEPLSLRDGLPQFDQSGGLWIKLTICGMTRLGYGHAAAAQFKDPGSREKEVIGDALRNAAMRFGAALELWHKGDLYGDDEDDKKAAANGRGQGTSGKQPSGNAGGRPTPPRAQGKPQGQQPPPKAPAEPMQMPKDDAGAGASSGPKGWQPTQPQLKRLFALKSKAKWTDDELKEYMKSNMGIESTKDMNRDQYEYLADAILDKSVPFAKAKAGACIFK